ncbi:MAG: N-acetylneuraminate synthase family protein [Pseudomonadota bacterium]
MITLNDGTALGRYEKPYIVAEFNTSHFGDVDLAKDMILECARIGVDCVKFQSWSTQTLYSQSFYAENKMAKRFVKKYALSEEDLLALSVFCQEQGIGFMSTPYSEEEARFLVERCAVPALKIASMEINNLPFLQAVGAMDTAVILSTGMADMGEIETAVAALQEAGCANLCVLHCVSRYPIENGEANLRNIQLLQDRLAGVPIGYSDHSLGLEAPAAAVALGACLIERHFTLDRSRIGMDNQMATEPEEFAQMIARCYETHNCMGHYQRTLADAEIEQRQNMRRSVVYRKSLAQGTVLSREDVMFKRPGTGIAPTEVDTIVGKTLAEPVAEDTLVCPAHFSH